VAEQLEQQIRDALAHRARALPSSGAERLLDVNFHPRSLRVSATVIGPVAGIAVAGLTIGIVGLGGATQHALAAWNASPTIPLSGQTAAAEAACRADMPSAAQAKRANDTATGTGSPEPGPALSPNALPLVLSDTRGAYTYVLMGTAGEQAACLVGPWPRSEVAFASRSEGPSTSTNAGQIGALTFDFGRLADEAGVLSVTGRAGEGVEGVTLILKDGTRVLASIADGRFLAWWPGTDLAISAELRTSQGTRTVGLDDPLDRQSSKLTAALVSPASAARRLSNTPTRR
jgi:hypothetical protein